MMSPSKLGLFACLALAANAIILPPSITAAELGDDNVLETLAINPLQRKVLVDCPECPVARLHNGINWVKEETGNTFVSDLSLQRHANPMYQLRYTQHIGRSKSFVPKHWL